ncbi:MAG: glucosaminidase domain-containing protein [Saprospiraceae bacterium]|nr:glucosaminidase domain-containing protein [Saprospiraceae bacterium]
MRKFILSLALLALTLPGLFAAPTPLRRQLAENYISIYRYIAVMESIRTGIPASIKLAQGMLESNSGQGFLALKSNNHFGIKWRGVVDGEFVEAYDDEKDKNGKKKPSKFIKFSTPEDSYLYHSDLLTSRPIYRSLFIFDRSDYRSWAKGLKKAGYATDPQYAEKLISIIEQYNLDRFDIPTQLSLDDDTPQYSGDEFDEVVDNTFEQSEILQPYPTKQATKASKVKAQSVVNTNKNKEAKKEPKKEQDEEEHILFEVTSPELASKSGNTIKNPVPKRQKK